MDSYLPLLVYVGVALLVPVVLSLLAEFIGGKTPEPAKYLAYESGHPTGPIHGRVPVKFYLIAMLFVIFDVEAVAFYPWAVLLGDLGLYGLWVMALFLIVFILGDLYVWKKGGFEWR